MDKSEMLEEFRGGRAWPLDTQQLEALEAYATTQSKVAELRGDGNEQDYWNRLADDVAEYIKGRRVLGC